MADHIPKFIFRGFTPPSDFVAFANERLVNVVHTAPFGATCVAEIERTKTGYKTVIKVMRGAEDFSGVANDSDYERSMQRCIGQVRSKTFKWRKDKLAKKNTPHEATAEELADPFLRMKKKMFTG